MKQLHYRRPTASRALTVAAVAVVLSAWIAPVAHAQIDVGNPVGDIGGGVPDAGVPDTGTPDAGGVTDPITDGIEGGSGGSGQVGSDPISDVIDSVDDTKETVEETTGDAGGTVGEIGAGTGDAVDDVTDTVDRTTSGLTNPDPNKKKNSSNGGRNPSGGQVTSPGSSQHADVLSGSFADALRTDGIRLAAAGSEGTDYAATGSESQPSSVITQIGRIAAEAVEQAAFPITLLLLVGAFLMVQNRIDSRDPKLALAPVDTEHDLLSFT